MGKEKLRNKRGVMTATYKLGKYERVNMEEVKLLTNGTVSGLAPVIVHERRGGVTLEVIQQGWTPLTAYQRQHMTDGVIMAFLKYTLRIACDCERYGLRIDNLCWDSNKVFADSQGRVRMIYWPVLKLDQDTSTALNFFRQFCDPMRICGGIDPQIVYRYECYFYQREHLDFPLFQQLMMEMIEQWQRDVVQREAEKKKKDGENRPDPTGKWYYGWLERPGKGDRFLLNSTCINIGRDGSRCELHLKGHITVGRQHAQIQFRDGQYYLVDLGSQNGTSVDGVPLRKNHPWPLADGVRIKFADVEYLFREAEDNRTMPIHQKKRG